MTDEQVFSDRYQLIGHIARGGMAQVYLAQDLRLGRPVALKVLFPELSVDRTFVERFRREAQAAANLTHPNIVSVYDWGQGDRTYFIVMEYVDGETLSQLIRKSSGLNASEPSRISPDRAAEIGGQVAAALDFAHRHGVIHRDVKPGNVLLDSSGNVKVTDFGIARAIGTQEGLTQTGAVMGTATYFSPEQAQGFGVDARSDVYSLGVVLYEMAVGHPPFAGENPLSIAYQHVRQDPPPPTTENRAVPPALEAIILKAMAKAPEARYQTAGEMRTDLERFQEGLPVLAEGELAAQTATRVQQAAPTVMGAAVGAGAVAGAVGSSRTATAPPGPPPPGYPTPYSPDGVPPEEERRSRRTLWAVLIALVVIAVGLGLYFGGKAAGWWGSSTRTVAVPNSVVGKTPAAAETELRSLGFRHFTTARQTSATIAAGHVATTRPGPGTPVRTDDPITLVVSTGPGSVDVPNVVGQPADEATRTLQRAGFSVNTTQQPSTTVAKGDVSSTTPGPGEPATKGSAIQLVVSSGVPQVQIPSLASLDPATAGSRLAGLQLSVTQANEPSATIASGRVTRTYPPAGTSVPVGSTVTVFVSTGPQQVTVPKLPAGATVTQAEVALSAAGFHVSLTSQPVTQPDQNGIVMSQNPPGGSQASQGSTVTLVVGQYTPPPTVITPTTTAPTTTTTPTTTPTTRRSSPPT